jgi:regulator of protease activity HflC (stomatin/prohibitin superfamily)
MTIVIYLVVLFIVVFGIFGVLRATVLPLERVIVFENQRGMKYKDGRFVGVLSPGKHWRVWKSESITTIDIRVQHTAMQGQEIPSADGVPVKISLAFSYTVVDPNLAIHKVDSYSAALAMHLQIALRNAISSSKVEDLLAGRSELGASIRKEVEPKVKEIGLVLNSADVRDIMVPGELKKIFAQVLKAQKEGLGALEKARGETAALRSLANAAKMIEENPNLLSLRLLQTMAETRGNTYVLGSSATLVPVKGKGTQSPATAPEGSSSGE